jgi:hypothetical protein
MLAYGRRVAHASRRFSSGCMCPAVISHATGSWFKLRFAPLPTEPSLDGNPLT